jgi:hypothetical protein
MVRLLKDIVLPSWKGGEAVPKAQSGWSLKPACRVSDHPDRDIS